MEHPFNVFTLWTIRPRLFRRTVVLANLTWPAAAPLRNCRSISFRGHPISGAFNLAEAAKVLTVLALPDTRLECCLFPARLGPPLQLRWPDSRAVLSLDRSFDREPVELHERVTEPSGPDSRTSAGPLAVGTCRETGFSQPLERSATGDRVAGRLSSPTSAQLSPRTSRSWRHQISEPVLIQ